MQSVFAKIRSYEPRQAADGVLHRVVQGNLEDFLEEARRRSPDGEGMPLFVEEELRKFLGCGLLAAGFARFKCEKCGHKRLVPFSCKRRGICPSCAGRRMAQKAAHLTDSVFPIVPVRQWVLSLPFDIRYTMAWDHNLTRRILGIFYRALSSHYRNKAKKQGIRKCRTGAVTVIQRAGGALNLNVHFHMAAMDGVFTEGDDGALKFHRVPAPTTDEVKALVKKVRKRVLRALGRDTASSDFFDDPLADAHPALASASAASVHGMVAFGKRAGRNVMKLGIEPDPEESRPSFKRKRHGRINGFDLHAGAPVPGHDRDRLERLLRYLLRPPIAQGRLSQMHDGRVLLKMKSPWNDGTTHLIFQPMELMEKLAAIIPRPQTNQLIYHGVLGPHSDWRRRVVAYGRPAEVLEGDLPKDEAEKFDDEETRHVKWADLMRRSFGIDVLECPKCYGRLELIALIDQPAVIKKILDHLGLPSELPIAKPARPPPEQLDFEESCVGPPEQDRR